MEKAAIIFNGIYFSFTVVDEAFAWAKNAHGSLLGIFLSSKKESGDGYGYPSDLDAVENLVSNKEAENENDIIIQSNRQILEHRSIDDQVTFESVLLYNPSKKELSDALQSCQQIFVAENIQEQAIATVESIDLKDFLDSIDIPVNIIPS